MAKITFWIITVSRDQTIEEAADRLRAEGLTIRDILTEIGCITGSADESTVERLKKVQGVVNIAPDMPINLGPPDSTSTW